MAETLASELNAAVNEPAPSLVVIPIDYRENTQLTKQLGDIEMRI